jgi:hypothetical protein
MVPIKLQDHLVVDSQDWVNAISSGNFASMLDNTGDQTALMDTMISIYNSAFITTNIALTGIALLFSFLILFYLRKETKTTQNEAYNV